MSVVLEYADRKGTLEVFPSRGQLNFSIKSPAEPALLEFKMLQRLPGANLSFECSRLPQHIEVADR